MAYIENPKSKGSGIVGAIPQSGRCPHNCKDCFFQSGRSYLEPLEENLPNLPDPKECAFRVVRVNDGNDSSVEIETVLNKTRPYNMKFYNTIIPTKLKQFKAPVVLTINPGNMTDASFHMIENPPKNLMYVRFRTNTWNVDLADQAVDYYSDREIPIVLTFMAYHDKDSIPPMMRGNYHYRDRTVNKYWAIDTEVWMKMMERYKYNRWVYSCGKEGITSGCRWCGNCLREYFATIERMKS